MGLPLIIVIAGVGSTFLLEIVYNKLIKPWIVSVRKDKKKHKEDLVTKILKPLQCSILKHKDFKVWIDGLEILENIAIYKKGDAYNWTFQHLQHEDYSDILISFQIVEAWIEELNIKLKSLDEYIDTKINAKDRNDFTHSIWDIVQTSFYEDTKIDYLKIIKKIENKSIHIARNENEGDDLKIPCIFGEEKTKKLILKLVGQKEFLSQLEAIQEEYNEVRKEFRCEFQETFLKKLIVDFDRKGKLKGECESCLLRIKLFWRLLIDRVKGI